MGTPDCGEGHGRRPPARVAHEASRVCQGVDVGSGLSAPCLGELPRLVEESRRLMGSGPEESEGRIVSQSREAVVRAIRDALGTGTGRRPPGTMGIEGPSVPDPAENHGTVSPDPIDFLDLFADRVVDYKATLTRCGTGDLADLVGRRLMDREVARLVVPPDLPSAWIPVHPECSLEVLRDLDPGLLTNAQISSAHGILTGCALAIAETGTLVLDGGSGQGRRVLSLLPDYHLCVVFGHQIVETVPEAIEAMKRKSMDPPSPLTMISGPSATSDIELIRVEGVHGPRTLDVLLVVDS